METPRGKAIFEKLVKFFKDQIYQQKNEQSEIQNFAASFNKNHFENSLEHFERDQVSSSPKKIVYHYQRTVFRH